MVALFLNRLNVKKPMSKLKIQTQRIYYIYLYTYKIELIPTFRKCCSVNKFESSPNLKIVGVVLTEVYSW